MPRLGSYVLVRSPRDSNSECQEVVLCWNGDTHLMTKIEATHLKRKLRHYHEYNYTILKAVGDKHA
jgi:hypothetical protein